MTIDAYLTELEQRLPRSARLRALPEIREHLRDSAAEHRAAGRSAFDAESAATREFGPVSDVARRFASELAKRETRAASALSLAAAVSFVFPLYVIPENTLPPASWIEKPRDIAVLQAVAIAFWLLGIALAVAGAALAWSRWLRYAPLALLSAAVAIVGAVTASAALFERWVAHTPSTPNWALAAPFALACLAACAAAAAWARRRRGLLGDDLVQD